MGDSDDHLQDLADNEFHKRKNRDTLTFRRRPVQVLKLLFFAFLEYRCEPLIF